MRFATVAEVKAHLSHYLATARETGEAIVVTHRGKPYALIRRLSEAELEVLDWRGLTMRRLRKAWAREADSR